MSERIKEENLYDSIARMLEQKPRDIQTAPIRKKEPLWFHVYVEGGELWIDRAKTHNNSSSIKNRRKLRAVECETMLDIYHRREQGEAISKEASETTINQVYWYGIFRELNL